jgi:hypothetical protein
VFQRDENYAGLREYASQREIDEQATLGVGMKEKAEEFVASAAERFISSYLINLKVKLILGPTRSEVGGTWCSQKRCVVPFISKKLSLVNILCLN